MNISKSWIKIKNNILDLIFPRFCVGCQLEGSWLCPQCFKKIIMVSMPVCPECLRLSPQGMFCKKCRKDKSLKGIIVSAYYEEGPIREAIHNFKYNSVKELAPILGKFLSRTIKENFAPKEKMIISFVPLHPRRLAQRGYNQAELLARIVAENLNLNCQDLLFKKKNTKKQVELKGGQRKKNLAGAFRLKRDIDLKGKKIILIDDITTTGTTLNEAAKILKGAGASEVWGAVIAQG